MMRLMSAPPNGNAPDPFTPDDGWMQLTAELAKGQTSSQVAAVVVQFARAHLAAEAGAVLLGTPQPELVLGARERDWPLSLAALAWQAALNVPEAQFFERHADFAAAFPALVKSSVAGHTAGPAVALLPFSLGDTADLPTAWLLLTFASPHAFDAQARRQVLNLGSLCALALGRTQALVLQQAAADSQIHTEGLMRQLIEGSPVGIAVGDLQGRLVLVNDAYLRLLGLSRAEYEAGTVDWTALTPPEYREADEAAFARAFREGSSGRYEKEMLHRSGERLPLSVTLLRYEAGQTRYVMGYLSDVREKRAAELLARTQAYEGFADLTRDLTLHDDPVRLVGRVQELLVSLLPSSVSTYYELRGATWQLLSHRGEFVNPALLSTLQRGLPRGKTVNVDAAFDRQQPYFQDYHDPDSVLAAREEIRVIQSSVAFPVFAGQQVRGVLAVGLHLRRPWTANEKVVLESVMHSLRLALERTDTLQLLQSQNAELAARTRALEGFADLTRDIDFQSDPYALIERAQQVVQALLPQGFAVYYEPQGGLWRLKSQVGSVGNPELQAVLDAGISFEGTPNLLIPWRSGQPYYQDRYDQQADHLPEATAQLQTTATLPVVVAGEPRGVFAFGLNQGRPWTATEKAVLEAVVGALGLALEGAHGVQTLRQRSLELERINRELEQFAFIASHDLQEPLHTVTNFTELLLRRTDLKSDPKAAQYAHFITDGTARMKQLILDLLTFSRVKQGQTLGRVDSRRVLELVLQDLRGSLDAAGAEVQVGPLLPVQADETQLRQLFQNLIGNAVKFRAQGRPPVVQVSAQPDGAFVRFEVRDNGIGIAPEHAERVFTLFQRLHRRDEYAGSGLGLAIARRILEYHGGNIWLESRVGDGTSFFFTLPAAH